MLEPLKKNIYLHFGFLIVVLFSFVFLVAEMLHSDKFISAAKEVRLKALDK